MGEAWAQLAPHYVARQQYHSRLSALADLMQGERIRIALIPVEQGMLGPIDLIDTIREQQRNVCTDICSHEGCRYRPGQLLL
jgi:hypothetical protein